MGTKNTPVDRAIAAFGAIQAVAEAAGVPVKRVYRWRQSPDTGGRGGRIPDDVQGVILDAARERKLPLSAEDLIYRAGDLVADDVQ